jgi:quercetin dioxygenase-like cupin family protein
VTKQAIVRKSSEVELSQVASGKDTQMHVLISGEEAPNFALRRFVMKPGGGMPLHTNLVEHEQYVLAGQAEITIGNEKYQVAKGDVVYIPAGAPHSYQASGNEDFEFLCLVPNTRDSIEILEKPR